MDDKVLTTIQLSNIMFDKRVVRGSNYAPMKIPAATTPTRKMRRRPKPREHLRGTESSDPPPGRAHISLQTDSWLEELTDVVEADNSATQTEASMDRPPTPLFIPQKSGQDLATQILAGELFDFDFEVEPIVAALVGRTLEIAIAEVLEEAELAALRAQQDHFQQVRCMEAAAVARLEEAERRRATEKAARVAQASAARVACIAAEHAVAVNRLTHAYVQDLLAGVFADLRASGFIFDPVRREVETAFLPWLKAAAGKALSALAAAQAAGAQVVAAALELGEQDRSAAERNARAALQAHAAEAERLAEEHRLADEAEHAGWLKEPLKPLTTLKAIGNLNEAVEAEVRQVLSDIKHEAHAALLASQAAVLGNTPGGEAAFEDSGEDVPDANQPELAAREAAEVAKAAQEAAVVVEDAEVLAVLLERGLVSRAQVRSALQQAEAAEQATAQDAAGSVAEEAE